MKIINHSLNPKDREAVAKMRTVAANRKGTFDRATYDQSVEQTPNAPDVEYEEGKVDGVARWWCLPKGRDKSSVILYLHGGVYLLGSAKAYRNFAGQVAINAGVTAFVADYRLAQEHTFQAGRDESRGGVNGLSQEF